MPLPLIVGAVAVGAGVLGAGATLSAKDNFDEAKSIRNKAESKYEKNKELFEQKSKQTQEEMAKLGKVKIEIQSSSMKDFIEQYKRISDIAYKEKSFRDHPLKSKFSDQDIRKLEDLSMKASDVLASGIKGVSTGVLAGVGATGFATTFGTASTGTLISTLSGAAAQNAALSWLGGGALSAGGYGMLGGSAVLGGVVAGPAILVTGIMLDSKSEKALTKAKEYAADVDVAVEEMKTAKVKLSALQARTFEMRNALNKLNHYFKHEVQQLKDLLAFKPQKVAFDSLTEKESKVLYKSQELAQAINALLNVDLMKEGNVTNSSKAVLSDVKELFPSIKAEG